MPGANAETRFGGPRGNIPGKTSEQREAEIRNAWLATKIRAQMLEAVATMVDGNPAAALERIDPATLKLLKDAEDRGLGTPKASVDVNNPDGNLKPAPVGEMVQELLAAIHAKPDAG
jgi:hypothetical protein